MARNSQYEQVEVEVDRLVRQTDKAGLFLIAGQEVWLPWSQIGEDSEVKDDDDAGMIYIPRWLAEKHELEYEEI